MSKEETIKNLKKLKSFHNGSYGIAIDEAIKAIEQQLKTGEWLTNPLADYAGEGYFICSKCENDVYDVTDFCPNCGARMVD